MIDFIPRVSWRTLNRITREAGCRDQLWIKSFLRHCTDERDCLNTVTCLLKNFPEKFFTPRYHHERF